jgi:hypothetical protein
MLSVLDPFFELSLQGRYGTKHFCMKNPIIFFQKWKEAKELEMRVKLAQSGRYKQYRRYMKNNDNRHQCHKPLFRLVHTTNVFSLNDTTTILMKTLLIMTTSNIN